MRTKIGLLGLVIAGLVIGSVVSNDAVRADATTPTVPVTPVKHHHHHHIHGKITAVDSTSITIKVHHRHKSGSTTTAAATTEEKTFKITGETKVVKVSETGGKTGISASDLKVGEHVSISAHEDVAHMIAIGHHHHKKKPVAA